MRKWRRDKKGVLRERESREENGNKKFMNRRNLSWIYEHASLL